MNPITSLNHACASIATHPSLNAALTLIARLGLASVFLHAGLGKVNAYAATAGYMSAMGVSASLLPLVILLELGAGLALAVGFLTRFAALALALFCVAAAFVFHSGHEMNDGFFFWDDIAMAGGLLFVFVRGAGRASIDGLTENAASDALRGRASPQAARPR